MIKKRINTDLFLSLAIKDASGSGFIEAQKS